MIGWASFNTVGNESVYLQDALESGWVSHGPYVEKLERRVSDLLGGGVALAVSNGTAALMLAFQTLDLKPGDRVIVPAFSFQAAANVLLQLGAEPVFCDIDPLNWNQTRASIEAVLDDTIKGVVVVHNYGVASEIGPIADLCRGSGIWLIEDAAEAWFTKYADRYVGRFGDIATFSMHATKTIACGEGGMVLVNRDHLVSKAQLHRSHGLDRTRIQYKHVLAGNNYRLSNLLAAVAFAQLERFETIIGRQQNRTKAFRQLLADVPGLAFQRSLHESTDEIWADAILLDSAVTGIERDNLLSEVKAAGVDMRPGFYTPSALSYYDNHEPNSFPVADRIAANIFVLPCTQFLEDPQINEIVETVTRSVSPSASDRISLSDLNASDPRDREQLQTFINGLPDRNNGFRYFESRDLDSLENHLCTILLYSAGEPIGYGHLDLEGDTVWLGIAIHQAFFGKNLGHTLMCALVERAADAGIARIDLFVDRDNIAAKKLYRRHGFAVDDEMSNSSAIRMFKTG